MAGKCLTVPSEARANDGHDNEHNDLILNVDDVLSSGSRRCLPIRLHWSCSTLSLIICHPSVSSRSHTIPERGPRRSNSVCLLADCRYLLRDLLGQGTLAQVVRCVREDSREDVAVKVIKNQTAFYHQVTSALCWALSAAGLRSAPDSGGHTLRTRMAGGWLQIC